MNAIYKFVMSMLAKRSGKTGITTIPRASGLNVELTAKQIEQTLKNMGVDVSKIKSAKEVEKFLNINEAWIKQQAKKSPIKKKDPFEGWTPRVVEEDMGIKQRMDKIKGMADELAKMQEEKLAIYGKKKPTEAEIKSKLEGMNKKTIERIKRRRFEAAQKAEREKMAKDPDYIPEILDPDDFLAEGGMAGLRERTGYFRGALADTKAGKAMSPGTRADYSPGQGHRATADASKQLDEITKMYNMKVKSMKIKPPKRSIREKIGGGINRVLNNPLVRGYAAWGTGGLSEKLRASMMAKQLYDNRHFLVDDTIEEEVSNIPTMGGITPAYAHGGRTGTGLNYLLGEDDQNVRLPVNQGGRIGFKKGTKFDPSKRKFLKTSGGILALLATLPGIGKIFKPFKALTKSKVLTQVPIKDISGMPPWFKPFVNQIIKKGDDVTKTHAYKDMQVVHKAQLPESKTEVILTQNIDTGDVVVDIGLTKHGFADGHLGQPVRLEYKAAEVIEPSTTGGGYITKGGENVYPGLSKKPLRMEFEKSGKGMKTKEEFWVEEAEFTGGHPENVKFEESTFEKFGDHGSDFSEVEKFATGKIKKAKPLKKREDLEWAQGRAEAEAQAIDDADDVFASGGRVPLVKGKIARGIASLGKKKKKKLTADDVSQDHPLRRKEFEEELFGTKEQQESKKFKEKIIKKLEQYHKLKYMDITGKKGHAFGGRVPLDGGGISQLVRPGKVGYAGKDKKLTKEQLEEMLNVKKPKHWKESPWAIPDDWLKRLKEKFSKADGGRVPLAGGKIVGTILSLLKNPKKIRAAVDDIFSTGDYKMDAEMAAEALVENNPAAFGGKLIDDLDDATRSEIYGAVLKVVQSDLAKMLQLKRLSRPTKTLEGIKKTGKINISDPNVADEFTRFMKETDSKGHKKIEEIVEITNFDPKGKKGHATGGLAGLLGE